MKPAYIVTGMGRSGTLWLARLLNEDPAIACGHERFGGDDALNYGPIASGKVNGRRYIEERLVKMTTWRKRSHPDQAWGEVNSYLRYLAPAMREIFGCPVVGLVRDGRYVVRSMMKRGSYQSKGRPPFPTPEGIEGPFARTCWHWADAYRQLIDQGVTTYKLEGLNSDCAYFELMCEMLGTKIRERAWRKWAGKRIHVSVESTEPPGWTVVEDEAFRRYAGDMQAAFGYDLPGCVLESRSVENGTRFGV